LLIIPFRHILLVEYARKPLVLVLIGLLVGLIAGVEFAHYSIGGVCPNKPCVDGMALTPITDREYGPKVLALVKNAEKTIHIASMEMKLYEKYPASTMNEIVGELVAAHERGVEVKILLDEYSKTNNAFEFLKTAGVDVRWDDNKTTTHSKLVIVDGKIVLLGSSNFSYYALEKNHETNVLIEDAKTAQYFEGYFQSLWQAS